MDIEVVITRFPNGDDRLGATDGRTIWLNAELSANGFRCTYEHEMEHVRRGHTSCQSEGEERSVRHAVARTLVDDSRLIETWRASRCMAEWADALDVTESVLEDRLEQLTVRELRCIAVNVVDEWEAA